MQESSRKELFSDLRHGGVARSASAYPQIMRADGLPTPMCVAPPRGSARHFPYGEESRPAKTTLADRAACHGTSGGHNDVGRDNRSAGRQAFLTVGGGL